MNKSIIEKRQAGTAVDSSTKADVTTSSQTIGKPNVGSSVFLSRAEAQFAFLDGFKISHKYFLEGEYVMLDARKNMIDENKIVLNKQDFWLSRGGSQFDDGWFVVVENYLRPKTRGELYYSLLKGIKCEVVASNEEFTTLALQSLSIMEKDDLKFKTTPSVNVGWVIYEAVA